MARPLIPARLRTAPATWRVPLELQQAFPAWNTFQAYRRSTLWGGCACEESRRSLLKAVVECCFAWTVNASIRITAMPSRHSNGIHCYQRRLHGWDELYSVCGWDIPRLLQRLKWAVFTCLINWGHQRLNSYLGSMVVVTRNRQVFALGTTNSHTTLTMPTAASFKDRSHQICSPVLRISIVITPC